MSTTRKIPPTSNDELNDLITALLEDKSRHNAIADEMTRISFQLRSGQIDDASKARLGEQHRLFAQQLAKTKGVVFDSMQVDAEIQKLTGIIAEADKAINHDAAISPDSPLFDTPRGRK
jgi:hypothetical protein